MTTTLVGGAAPGGRVIVSCLMVRRAAHEIVSQGSRSLAPAIHVVDESPSNAARGSCCGAGIHVELALTSGALAVTRAYASIRAG